MPIKVGIEKLPLGDCPVCGRPLRVLLGIVRCSDGRCDYVKPQEDEIKVQGEEAKIRTAGAHIVQEEHGRLRRMLPKIRFRPRGSGNGSDEFLKGMVDPSKDPMENGKAKKKGDEQK